jgi:hypothetical protein
LLSKIYRIWRASATFQEVNMREPESATIDSAVMRLRIIVGALIAGCLGLAGLSIVLRGQGIFGPGPALPIISFIAAFQALATLAIRPMVLNQMLRGARQKLVRNDADSDAAWMQMFMTRTIVGAALFEGSAFFFFIAYLLEGEWWALAGGLLMVALLAVWHFPVKTKIERWIEEQCEAVRNAL